MSQALQRSSLARQFGATAVLPFRSAAALGVCLCAALLGAAITPAASLDAAITDNNARIFVAPLPSVLNTRTLTDYDVPRFFTQFGADPNGVWSNPIGNYVGERDDMELHNTYMYGLDVLFHRQLLQSPLRVHTSAEADVVFLPIYADIGCRLSQENPDDAKAWNQAIETFWSTFQQTYPDAHKKPHFVVTGRREAENMGGCPIEGKMYNGKVDACNFLCHPYAKDLLMLTVEVYTGSLDQMGEKALRPNSVVVPWPGHWHLHLGSRYFSAPFDKAAHVAARQYLAMESLKVRLPLREQLFKSCTERSDQCLHYAPRGRISQFNQSEIYDVIKSAWYCIQPPGDGPSRHATMDCLAADTMPVFFDQHLTAVMPFSDIVDYADFTEYIDPQELQTTQANAIDVLQSAFTKEKALVKAQRLHQIKHVFLYALNPAHSLIRWHEAYAVHPLDDAFTSSMKALLRKSCELGMLGKCDKAEAGRATSRGTAKSAAPKGLLRSGTAATVFKGNTSDTQSDSKSDSQSAAATAAADSSEIGGSDGSDPARVLSATSYGAGGNVMKVESDGDTDDMLSDTQSDSIEASGESADGGDEGEHPDEEEAALEEEEPDLEPDLDGDQEPDQDDDQEPDLEVAQPKVIKAPALSRKSNPGGKSSEKEDHTTGSGDGSPAVKRGDSLNFPNTDERDMAAAEEEAAAAETGASQQALTESDQEIAGGAVSAERQYSEGHTTGGGDGSPAAKRRDSIRFPNRDERDVAEEQVRDTAEEEETEEMQSISVDENAR